MGSTVCGRHETFAYEKFVFGCIRTTIACVLFVSADNAQPIRRPPPAAIHHINILHVPSLRNEPQHVSPIPRCASQRPHQRIKNQQMNMNRENGKEKSAKWRKTMVQRAHVVHCHLTHLAVFLLLLARWRHWASHVHPSIGIFRLFLRWLQDLFGEYGVEYT